jgi:lipopolysaccharide export system permease protein
LYQDWGSNHKRRTGLLIIKRYVTREISRPFLIIVSICGVIFASFTTAVILNEVAAGLIPAGTVANLVLIRLVIALEMLIPVSLYFGVVFGLGRLHSDSEIVALSAGGIGEPRLVGIVLQFSLLIALVVACISMFARPWAYQQQYLLRAQVAAEFDIAYLEARQLLVNPGSDYAIFAATVDHKTRSAGEVIVQIRKPDVMQIITAKSLFQPPREQDAPPLFTFKEGYVYELDTQGSNDVIGRFGTLNLTLSPPEPKVIGYKSKAEGLLALSKSRHRKDLAEFQWRLSTPAATVLIALLAVPLSRSGPRGGRFAKALTAVAAYAVFFNLMTFAKNLVQEGLVGAVPGLWWPIVLLGLLLAALFWRPSGFARA